MVFSVLSGSVTLAVMILPLVMRSTEESLLTVPDSLCECSFALDAGKLRTVSRIVLPGSIRGIFPGVVLAAVRIGGEIAALIYTAGTVAQLPSDIFASAHSLSLHMYILLSEGLYTGQAYAVAVVLLGLVVIINSFFVCSEKID